LIDHKFSVIVRVMTSESVRFSDYVDGPCRPERAEVNVEKRP